MFLMESINDLVGYSLNLFGGGMFHLKTELMFRDGI